MQLTKTFAHAMKLLTMGAVIYRARPDHGLGPHVPLHNTLTL